MLLSGIALVALSGPPFAQAQPVYSFALRADNSGPLSSLQTPLINAGGSVAFASSLDAGGSGIYTVAPSGSPIQAAGTGATFNSFGFGSSNGFNAAGTIAFQAGLTAGGSGVFTVPAGGSPVTVAQTGPGFIGFGRPALNSAGTVAFAGFVGSGQNRIYTSTAGGAPMQVVGPDATFTGGFGQNLALSDTGTVAFSGVRTAGGQGLYRLPAGGTPAEVANTDGPISNFLNGGAAINSVGTVAFTAALDAGGTALDMALIGYPPVQVADTSGQFSNLGPGSLNDSGTLAFVGDLAAGGRALYLLPPGGSLMRIIGTGDALDGSTISGLTFPSASLNDAGQIAFTASLVDGRQGVFVATPVPEPSSLALLGVGGLAAICLRRQRIVRTSFSTGLLLVAALFATAATAPAQQFPLYGSMEGGDRIMKFTSGGVGSIFADFTAGLSSPCGLTFDTAGNLYVANANTSTVVRLTPGGVGSVFIGSGLLGQGPLGGMTFDGFGNLFVAIGVPGTGGAVKKFSSTGADLGIFASSGISNPYDLTFDTSGNLYVPNGGNSTIRIFTPAGVGSTLADNGLLNHPTGVAFDRLGNLYAANGGDSNIVKFTGGVPSVFAGPANGVSAPYGLAFDGAGNLFVANSANQSILKLTPGGVGSTFSSGGLLSLPFGLAFQPTASPFVRVTSFATPIPSGTGNFTSLPAAPGYSSSGQVAFYGEGVGGQAGIYRMGTDPPIKVADLNTAIPSGSGNFTAFFQQGPPIIPSIDGGNVAFFGAGAGGQQGVYVSMNGPPIRVANSATTIPGGVGTFTAFSPTGIAPSPAISGNKVAFFGAGSGGQQGVYTYDYVAQVGPPIRIADTSTAIPGGIGSFTAFPQHPSLSGDNVALLGTGSAGQQGIYRASNGPPIKVADLNTAIPSGNGNFTSFMAIGPPIAPAIDGTSVAFFGAGIGGQQGIYLSGIVGPPIKVADTATAIPGGTGLFLSFADVSLSATDVAFRGFGANGQQGIFDLTGGSLIKVVDLTDIIGGRSITGLNLSRTGLFGDPVAFQATFADGSQGVYTAVVPVPEPGAVLLCGFGAFALASTVRRRLRPIPCPGNSFDNIPQSK